MSFFFLIPAVLVQNIECTRESRIITIYISDENICNNFDGGRRACVYYFRSLSTRLFERNLRGRLIVERDIAIASCLRTNENSFVLGKTGWKRRNERVIFAQFYFSLGEENPFSSSMEPRTKFRPDGR